MTWRTTDMTSNNNLPAEMWQWVATLALDRQEALPI